MALLKSHRLLSPVVNVVRSAGSTRSRFLLGIRSQDSLRKPTLYRLLSISIVCTEKDSSPHFRERTLANETEGGDQTLGNEVYRMPHPIWSEDDLNSVKVTHQETVTKIDKLAYGSVQFLRIAFDIISLYKVGKMTENKWLNRIIMLETVAGVPGMISAMARHFHSLRKLTRDHGWIHTLLEEAENERMHLMTALELKQPGMLFRGVILLAQGVFVNCFFIAYMLSPRFCHRFVGYLEEEAVKTYTYCLECIDDETLLIWKTKPAPRLAVNYWRLKEGAVMRDVILAIRADEAHHRVVNHTLSSIHLNEKNPFSPGQKKL